MKTNEFSDIGLALTPTESVHITGGSKCWCMRAITNSAHEQTLRVNRIYPDTFPDFFPNEVVWDGAISNVPDCIYQCCNYFQSAWWIMDNGKLGNCPSVCCSIL